MAQFDRGTIPLPDDLASAMDLTPESILAVFGSWEAPIGYLTALPAVGPEAMLEIWQNAFDRLAPLGFRPVLYEPRREPGAGDTLREEPGVLEPPHSLSTAGTETREESGWPVYRSAEDVLQAAAGNDVEQSLLTPRDDADSDALADAEVPADELVQLPSGATARVDHGARFEDEPSPADLFLAHVRAADPGEALARVYLGGYQGASGDMADMLSILRSWHGRFGAELLQVKAEAAAVEIWVPNPPQSGEERYRLGREALAFWPPGEQLWEAAGNPARLGSRFAGRRVWSFSAAQGRHV